MKIIINKNGGKKYSPAADMLFAVSINRNFTLYGNNYKKYIVDIQSSRYMDRLRQNFPAGYYGCDEKESCQAILGQLLEQYKHNACTIELSNQCTDSAEDKLWFDKLFADYAKSYAIYQIFC